MKCDGVLFLTVFTLLCAASLGYNNGYGMKPFLGWQSWCAVGKCGTDLCHDQQIRDTAKALVDTGMKDLGYEWVVIDDCWHPTRDANGTLVPFKDYFPNGIKPVVDYVHSLGLKFGLYTSVGDLTCHKGWSPGSFGHYQQDADLFASWEVDYVKVDWCGGNKSVEGHINISNALNKTGRPMVLELCRGVYESLDHWGYAPSIAQVWRADGDHHDSFSHTLEQLAAIKNKSTWSGPFGWAYMDMMMIGGEGCMPSHGSPDPNKPSHCPGQSEHEYRTEGATYSVTASPMMIGTDIRDMTPVMTEVLLNKKLIAINQDYLAPAGFQTTSCGSIVWIRHLSNGTTAVAAPNLGSKDTDISVCFADVGWKDGTEACIYDVWSQAYIGVFNTSYVKKVKSHDNIYVVLEPAANCPPGPPPPPPPPPSPPPSPSPPAPPGSCTITLTKQISKHHKCEEGKTYGCGANKTMWVSDGCAAIFTCDGTPNIDCESRGEQKATCPC